jgi:hypothetical protein
MKTGPKATITAVFAQQSELCGSVSLVTEAFILAGAAVSSACTITSSWQGAMQ